METKVSAEGDYVLGTGDDEIERLGWQHVVWRSRALDAWQRAGFTVGQTVLDVGCGPGHASVDLAQIVGQSGRVVAIDRSSRFLDALRMTARARRLQQIEPCELDLDHAEFPSIQPDGAWFRWILAFVKKPRDLLARTAVALRSGGVLVVHEYFDYGTWRVMPRSPEIEEFVRIVMASWRADGGEPDIGLDLPVWLNELGFEVRAVRPIIDVVPPGNLIWQWPKTFFYSGLRRLVELGQLSADKAQTLAAAFARCEETPHSLMITPAVLEVIAVRR